MGKKLDALYLVGAKRPCMVRAVALRMTGDHPGPIWTTKSGLGGMDEEEVTKKAKERKMFSYVTLGRDDQSLTVDVDTDSDLDA